MSKIKLRIDARSEPNAFAVPSEKDVVAFMGEAGWTDHPGDGKAILLDDGREVVNPLPHDPPIGFVQQESIVDQVIAKLNARRIMQLQDEEEIDLEAEVNDFDVPDEVDFTSVYEVTMQDEYPGVPVEKEKDDGGNSGADKVSGEGGSAGASGGGDPGGDKKPASVRKSRSVAGSEGEGGDDKAPEPDK